MENKVVKWVLEETPRVDAVALCFITGSSISGWKASSCSSRTGRSKRLQRLQHLHRIKNTTLITWWGSSAISALPQSTQCVLSTWSPKSFAVLLARRTPAIVAVSLAVVAGEAVLGVGVRRAGGGEASAVLRQVAVACLRPTDAACRF